MAGSNRYLLNRDGRYFARLVIPKDLRPFLDNKTELRAPLGPDRRTAQARLHTAVADLQARIAVAERRAMIAKGEALTPGRYPLPVEQIALRNYNEGLAFDLELRNSNPVYARIGIDDRMVELLREHQSSIRAQMAGLGFQKATKGELRDIIMKAMERDPDA